MPWRTNSNYNFGSSYDWERFLPKAGAATAYAGETKPFLHKGEGTGGGYVKSPEMVKLVNFLRAAHSAKSPVGISKLESLLFEAPTPIGKSACYTGEIVDSNKNKIDVNVSVVSKAPLANPVAKAAMATHVQMVSKFNHASRGIANMELFLENNDFMFTVMPSSKIQAYKTTQGANPEYANMFINRATACAKTLHFSHVVHNGFALPLMSHEAGCPKLTQFYTAKTLQRSSNGWAMKRDGTQALTGQDSMYAAPEVLVTGQNYSFAADFFSIGCSAFELATGLRLWEQLIGKATSDPLTAQIAMAHDSASLQKAIDALLKKNIKDEKLRDALSNLLTVNAQQRQKLCDTLPQLSASDTVGQEFAAANIKNPAYDFGSVFEHLAGASPTSTRGVKSLHTSVTVPGASTTFYHKKSVTHDGEGADWGTGLAVTAAAGLAASACMYFATSNLIKQGSTMTTAGPATLAISNGMSTEKSEDGKMQIEVVPAVATQQPAADDGMKAKIAGLLGCLVPTVAGVTYLATKESGDKKTSAGPCKSETETLMFSETGPRMSKFPQHTKEEWETKLLESVLENEVVITKTLSKSKINKIIAAMETVEFSAGQKVIKTGEVADDFFVYRKGHFATSTGKNMPADGYVFNEAALLCMLPSGESITAVGASSAFKISRKTFKSILLQ